MRHLFLSLITAALIWLASATLALAQEPVTVITSTNEAESGFIFTAPGGTGLLIMEDNGATVFSRTVETLDFKRQGDVLSYWDAVNNEFKVLNSDYQEIDSWAAVGYLTDLHDLQLLPNGHALLLVYREFTYDMSLIVPGGSPTATVISCVVQEIAPDKSLAWQWDTWDYLPITQTNRSLTANRIDYAHCNAVEQDDDGNILLSSRTLDEITKINRQTSQIIWRLGGQGNEFTFTNDAGFELQHDIRRLDNGNITIFDNGPASRGYSRAVEYEIDEVNKVITKTWEFQGPFASCCGNAQRLPGGNTFINFGPGHPTMMEVKPDGTIVFAADTPFAYRSFRFVWLFRHQWLPVVWK
jgi:hypothetical protein